MCDIFVFLVFNNPPMNAGMYMWDVDSYTKQMYEIPWEEALLIDWVREERNYTNTKTHQSPASRAASAKAETCESRPYEYTFKHYAEGQHATEAITQAAEGYMRKHAQKNAKNAQQAATCDDPNDESCSADTSPQTGKIVKCILD